MFGKGENMTSPENLEKSKIEKILNQYFPIDKKARECCCLGLDCSDKTCPIYHEFVAQEIEKMIVYGGRYEVQS